MKYLAILFGISIFVNGIEFASIDGRWAQGLELSGAMFIPWVPWIALAIYISAVAAIRKIKSAWKRWVAFAVASVAGSIVVGYPLEVLHRQSVRISITRFLNRESQQAFEAKYHVKWVSYSSSSEGTCVRVRRDDYTPELAAFVTALADQQAAPGKGAAH